MKLVYSCGYIKEVMKVIILMIPLLMIGNVYAQCNFPETCEVTDLNNFGLRSYNDPASLEYDNFVANFHATLARTSKGVYELWGQNMANNGTGHVLSPRELTSVNYPALTGSVLRAGLGSVPSASSESQGIVLSTTGLFAWGTQGRVLNLGLTTSTTFQKLTINGKSDGLPQNVTPLDVKMLFVTDGNVVIVTCSGEVWVLTRIAANAGIGTTTSVSQTVWHRVLEGLGTPLENVIAVRGNLNTLFALKSDGSLWTWGAQTYLGNNTIKSQRTFATKMELPSNDPVKMIGVTTNNNTDPSYYALTFDGNLYSLGDNSFRQLGDWTTTERRSWVQPRYTSSTGPVMDNIHWISPNEHDAANGAINVLTEEGEIFNWGHDSRGMLGRLAAGSGAVDPGVPAGVNNATDRITAVETGGHTTMIIKDCTENFGYVGHKVNGSMGDGSGADSEIRSFSFATAKVMVCGASALDLEVSVASITGPGGLYCNGSTIELLPDPSGGVFRLISGDGILVGNSLTFTGSGNSTVVVEYEVELGSCPNTTTAQLTLNSEDCLCDPIEGVSFSVNSGPNNSFTGRISSGEIGTDYSITTNNLFGYSSASLTGVVNGRNGSGLQYQMNDSQSSDRPDAATVVFTTSNTTRGYDTKVRLYQVIDRSGGNNEASTYTISWTGGDGDAILYDSLVSSTVYNFGFPSDFDLENGEVEGLEKTKAISNGGSFVTYASINSQTKWYVEFPVGATNITVNKVALSDATVEGLPNTDPRRDDPSSGVDAEYPRFGRAVGAASGETFNEWMSFRTFLVPTICYEEEDPFITPVDYNVTDVNVPVTGDVSTNDVVPAGTTYGTPQPDSDNPAGATIVMNADGTYVFEAPLPGVYNYLVPVCEPGQTEDCPLVALQITVLDPMSDENPVVANPDLAVTKEDSPVTIDILENDRSGNLGKELDPSSVKIAEQPDNGTVTVNADGTVTYTPKAGFVGIDVFSYTVCEVENPTNCSTTNVYVTVIPEDNADVTLASDDFAIVRGTADGTNSVSGNVLGNDSNTGGENVVLATTLVTDPSTLPGELVFNSDGSYTFTPNTGFSGPVSVVYTACGGNPETCATATLYILVEPVLDPQPDFNATFVGIPVKGDVSTNDALPVGTEYGDLKADLRNPADAIIKMNPDGTYEFEAPLPGVYNFIVPVCTPDGECVETLLTITVYSLREPSGPIVNPDLGVTKVNTPVVLNTLGNDSAGRPGVELDPASVVVAQQPANGTVKVDPVTGNIIYTPNPGFIGIDTYTYTVCDTGNPVLCSTTVQKVTVIGDDAPNSIIASDDFGSATTSGVVIGNVLANDMDPEKDNMTVTPQKVEVDEGVFTLNADGTYEFVPVPGFIGPISFVYKVCDNGTPQACANATLYILIKPNDIEANIDNFQDNEINGLLGGTAGNVLDNDKINGKPVEASEVVITVKDDGGMTGVVINSDGNLIVPKGTAPGTYIITYTICDVLDPTNCDEAIAIVEVFHGVNLRITKLAESEEWFEGDQFGFTLIVENNGETDASAVEVIDLLPEGLRYVSSTVDGATAETNVNGQQITWTVASLPAGSSFQIKVLVKAAPLDGGRERTLVNTASVGSLELELTESDNSSSAAVKVKAFFIPNTITPNGDRVNDTFEIPGLVRYVSNELLIFNRWGDHVYERKNYQNDWGAEGLVSGTYFYLLKVIDEEGKSHEFKGFIQVVKERIR